LENYWLLHERQPEIGGALSCQRMLAFLYHPGWRLDFLVISRLGRGGAIAP